MVKKVSGPLRSVALSFSLLLSSLLSLLSDRTLAVAKDLLHYADANSLLANPCAALFHLR